MKLISKHFSLSSCIVYLKGIEENNLGLLLMIYLYRKIKSIIKTDLKCIL